MVLALEPSMMVSSGDATTSWIVAPVFDPEPELDASVVAPPQDHTAAAANRSPRRNAFAHEALRSMGPSQASVNSHSGAGRDSTSMSVRRNGGCDTGWRSYNVYPGGERVLCGPGPGRRLAYPRNGMMTPASNLLFTRG